MEQMKKLLKDSPSIRFLVLAMISVLMFGTYWFQDGLGPLKGLFESQLGFTSSQFGLLISSTTWANLALMVILGGIALDRWGIRKTGVILGVDTQSLTNALRLYERAGMVPYQRFDEFEKDLRPGRRMDTQ